MPTGTLESYPSNFELRLPAEGQNSSPEELILLDPEDEVAVSALRRQLENCSVEELLKKSPLLGDGEISKRRKKYEIPIEVKAKKSGGGNLTWGICQGCDCKRMARLSNCRNGVT